MAFMTSELTAAEVEAGTGGTLVHGSKDTIFANVSIDTRSLQCGDIFFAIRGPNQDGHRFIPDALSRGALGAVVERDYEYPGQFPAVLVKVEDTHKALKDLAMAARRRWPGNLVAITGSMGKTTTRTFVAQVLQSAFAVYQTPGNYNNLFGLPLALFGLRLQHNFGIFEMGMSAPGEIAEMCRIAAPTIGILTNVAPVHLAFFNSVEDIAQAKEELAQALPPYGTLIYNADDRLVRDIAGRFAGRKISFGFSDLADVRADHVVIGCPEETRFDLCYPGTTRTASVPFAGAHYVMNALPAIALGHQYSIPPEQMVESLGQLQQASMRGGILRFAAGFAVIDDSYNSNPHALMKMIDVLSGIPSFVRRVLVAGEMLELGKDSDAMHFECGTYAASRRLDMVIGIQGAAREIVRAAWKSGMSDTQACFFDAADAAADFLGRVLRKGDLVLVKGSRGVHTEKILQSLRLRFELLN
jgi:UDP-N-acetylmuramoyl-tripeptide--D-alanyl-D-alanine ligase